MIRHNTAYSGHTAVRRLDGLSGATARSRQKGVVLIIALIALVALTLAGVGFMRSVDTAGLVAGNLAFNRVAVLASDAGSEAARGALAAATFDTTVDNSGGSWYWAQWQSGFDPKTYDWAGNSQLVNLGTLPAAQQAALDGYEIRYVVHRMCESAGDPVTAGCSYHLFDTPGGASTSVCTYGSCTPTFSTTSANPFYRVTSRIVGPRNTMVFVQVLMY